MKILLLAVLLTTAGCANPVERQMAAYKDSRLAARLSEYELARTHGEWLTACTKAGQIAAAYRESGSPNAVAWDAKRKEDCNAALDRLTPPSRG